MSTVISKYLPRITGMSTVLSSLPLQKVPTTVVAKIPPAEVTPAVTAPVTTASTPPTTVISKYLPKISTISTVARSLSMMSKETEKETEQLIEQAYEQVKKKVAPTVPAPTVPTVPEWTHKLVLGFLKMPWANEGNVGGAVSSIVVPLVNPFITVLGFDYVKYELDWAASTVTLYYRKRGSPAIPLVAILAAVAVCAIVVGVVWVSCNWLEGQKIVQQERTELTTLLQQGKISEDTYKQLTTGVAEGAAAGAVTGLETVTNIIPLAIIAILGISIIGAIPKGRKD